MTNQTAKLIADAKCVARIGVDASNVKLVTIRAICKLKTSRNASKMKAKWQAAIDALEEEYAVL